MKGVKTMTKLLNVIPAYGRVYANTQAAIKDWLAGKDFKIRGKDGPYLSIRDSEFLKNDGYALVRIYPSMLHSHYETKVL
jgi:hypothetical protein